jgi:hypothetical protein
MVDMLLTIVVLCMLLAPFYALEASAGKAERGTDSFKRSGDVRKY